MVRLRDGTSVVQSCGRSMFILCNYPWSIWGLAYARSAYVFILFAAVCVPEQNNDAFGIVNTSPDRTLDTSEEVDGWHQIHRSKPCATDAVLEDPFAADEQFCVWW